MSSLFASSRLPIPYPPTFFEQKNQLLFLLLTSRGYNFYCLCVIFLKKQYFYTQFWHWQHRSVAKLVECSNGESKVYCSILCGYKFYDLHTRIWKQAGHRSRFFVIAITIPMNSENLDRDPDLDTKKILWSQYRYRSRSQIMKIFLCWPKSINSTSSQFLFEAILHSEKHRQYSKKKVNETWAVKAISILTLLANDNWRVIDTNWPKIS